VLCCAVLCCAVLCCAVLCCAVLCCAVLCCAVQVSGEAQYTDDVSLPPNTLHAAFVTSSSPHARLLGVDPAAALAMPGRTGGWTRRVCAGVFLYLGGGGFYSGCFHR